VFSQDAAEIKKTKLSIMDNRHVTPEGQWYCTLADERHGLYWCKGSDTFPCDGCKPFLFGRKLCIPFPSVGERRIAHFGSCECPPVRGGSGRGQGRRPFKIFDSEDEAVADAKERADRVKRLRTSEAKRDEQAAKCRAEIDHSEDGGVMHDDSPPSGASMESLTLEIGRTGGLFGVAYSPVVDESYFLNVVNLLTVRVFMTAKCMGGKVVSRLRRFLLR